MSEPDIDAQPPASAADWLEVHPEDRHPYGLEPRTAWQAQGATADTAELHLDETRGWPMSEREPDLPPTPESVEQGTEPDDAYRPGVDDVMAARSAATWAGPGTFDARMADLERTEAAYLAAINEPEAGQ